MLNTRVTPVTLSSAVMAGLQSNLERLQRTQEQLSSGRRLSVPSDSPVDTVAAMQLRAERQQGEQLARNIDDGLAWLGTADSALTQGTALLGRVRQLVVAGASDSNGPEERAAMADEVEQLRAGIIGVANTQYLARPVFGGTQDTTTAFDPATGAYLGNASTVNRRVSTESGSGVMAVSVPGEQVFSTLFVDAADVSGRGILTRVVDALQAGDSAALGVELANLDQAAETMRSAQSSLGARSNRLLGVQTMMAARTDAMTASLATVESIDLPRTIIDLQIQQTGYQAALGAAARIIQPSLMDFLR